jgi:hypothetical protein
VAELEWSSPHSQILDEEPFLGLLPQSEILLISIIKKVFLKEKINKTML